MTTKKQLAQLESEVGNRRDTLAGIESEAAETRNAIAELQQQRNSIDAPPTADSVNAYVDAASKLDLQIEAQQRRADALHRQRDAALTALESAQGQLNAAKLESLATRSKQHRKTVLETLAMLTAQLDDFDAIQAERAALGAQPDHVFRNMRAGIINTNRIVQAQAQPPRDQRDITRESHESNLANIRRQLEFQRSTQHPEAARRIRQLEQDEARLLRDLETMTA